MTAAEAEAEAGSDVLTGVTRGGAGFVTGDLTGTLAADSGGDCTGPGDDRAVFTGEDSGSDDGGAEEAVAAAVGEVTRGLGGGDTGSLDGLLSAAAAVD